MNDTGLDAIRAARRELDEVIAEIRAVPGHEDFLAAPTFTDISAVAETDRPLVYLAAADAGGLALVVRGEDVSDVSLEDLTADAVRARVGAYLAAAARRGHPAAPTDPARQPMTDGEVQRPPSPRSPPPPVPAPTTTACQPAASAITTLSDA